MSGEELSLIKPLVDHLMERGDIKSWRTALADSGAFTLEETMALDESACRAAFKAMKTTMLMHASTRDILDELEREQVCWSVDLNDDFQQGAICY